MQSLEDLLKPKKPEFKNYLLVIQGQPKTSKTTLAVTASKYAPPPAQWDPKKPVELKDLVWLQFEPNALMYPATRGAVVQNVLDWSSQDLTWATLMKAVDALPKAAEQWRNEGATTIVVDTVSTFNRMLLRDIIERPNYAKDMERIRAYGRVDDAHYALIDNLRATKLNVIVLMHLNVFQPFGEEGGNSEMAQAMKAQAEKAINKVEASNVAGVRTEFIPDMRPKPAGYLTRLADAVLVAKPEMVAVRAGVKELKYRFVAQPNAEFSAGGRWDLPAVNDGYLYPHIKQKYGEQ